MLVISIRYRHVSRKESNEEDDENDQDRKHVQEQSLVCL